MANDLTAASVTDSGYDAPFTGTITAGATDTYILTASAGTAVRLRATDFDSAALHLELVSPSGQTINIDGVFAFPESGDYTLRVQGILATDVGDYPGVPFQASNGPPLSGLSV